MRKTLQNSILCLVTLLLPAGCHEDEWPAADNGNGSGDAGSYVTLRIGLAPKGRSAGPANGENGDGEEQGINNENNVYDLTMFVYTSASDRGANDDAGIPVQTAYYLKDIDFRPAAGGSEPFVYRSPVLRVGTLLEEKSRVIVACNMGDLTHLRTLGEIRDYAVAHPWAEGAGIAGFDRFTMASEDEAALTLRDGMGNRLGYDEDKPVEIDLNVERTAARIDFCANDGAADDDHLFRYAVRATPDAAATGEFHLTHVRLVNVMQQPSRLLKATADDPVAGVITYYGRETVDAEGHADNYVVEPTTPLKTEQNRADAGLLDSWFGATAAAGETKPGFFATDYAVAGKKLRTTNEDGRAVKSYIVGYARENTLPADAVCAEYVTGLALRGTYRPLTVYSACDADGNLTQNTAFAEGMTFWRCLKVTETPVEADALYFSNEAAAEAYRKAHPESIWHITKYDGGVCYYNVWIRHANDDAPLDGPMEYGIVRNNIYRVSISTLTGPGTPQPDPRGPNGIHSVIYVKKWLLRQEQELVM